MEFTSAPKVQPQIQPTKNRSKSKYWIIFVVMALFIVGLIIANIIIRMTNNQTDANSDGDAFTNTIVKARDEIANGDADAAIATYEEYIKTVSSDEDRAYAYLMLVSDLYSSAKTRNQTVVMLKYAKIAEEIYPSVLSSFWLCTLKPGSADSKSDYCITHEQRELEAEQEHSNDAPDGWG